MNKVPLAFSPAESRAVSLGQSGYIPRLHSNIRFPPFADMGILRSAFRPIMDVSEFPDLGALRLNIIGSTRPYDAAEADVTGGAIDHLGMSRSRPIAAAVVFSAKV